MSWDKEKRPRPVAAGRKGKASKSPRNDNPHRENLPPERCIRLLVVLLQRPVTREEADRIAPASNAPHYIHLLRCRFRLELPCERVPFVTKDGKRSRYGRYHATETDRRKIREILSSIKGANDD